MQRFPTLSKLMFNLEEYKKYLAKTSRTSKLWLQYLDNIAVVKMFIRAERTGDWNLHLVSLNKMLNLFAATAHVNYAKCARLHLQNMLDLESSHPWDYDHTVRRSERFWSGLTGDDESIEEQRWSDARKRYFGIYSPVMDRKYA